MMYLLDTNVMSEFRKASTGKIDLRVKAWAQRVPDSSMFLSAVSILELEKGVLLMERRDPLQGRLLRTWLAGHVLSSFAGRILSFDAAVAQRCARLHVPTPRSDRDSMIAATALEYSMTVVTRNVNDFAATGVMMLNPWQP